MCRRHHGAAFVTWVGARKKGFALISGAESLARHRSSDHGTRSFCVSCGSSLFCESSLHPDRIDVALASLSGPVDRLPQGHVYFSDRAFWYESDDDLPRLGGPGGLEPLHD